jgi:RimJ/RimL family protein N-acetyltransferase
VSNLDLDELIVRKCDLHIDTLPHMLACRKSSNYLGKYLDWGRTAPKWSIKAHTQFLNLGHNKKFATESYVAYYKDKFAGLFTYGFNEDDLGGQICYWVPKEFAGLGIATEVTTYLTDLAFLKFDWGYVQLHIDVANEGSIKVAKKSGFHVLNEYKCEVNGTNGTGLMNTWVKYSPDLLKVTEEERLRVFETSTVKPRSLWYSSGIGRIANDIFNNSELVNIDTNRKLFT